MVPKKSKLNKSNSSGWLDNYSEESAINEYQKGGEVKGKKSTLAKLKKALSLRENLGNLNTEEGYNIPLNQILKTAIGLEGEDFSNKPMLPIAREQDALRMYLGMPSKTGAFEQTGPNKYRIRDYGQLYPETMPSDEAVLYSNKINTAVEMDKSPVDLNKIVDLTPYADILMGTHNVVKGKDTKGEYLRYYDRFDFDPTRYANQFIDKNVNPTMGKYLKKATPILDKLENLIFNPFELEDKIYYDPKTKLRSDIILQQNKQKVVPGQPVAIPDFAGGGKVKDNKGYLISNLDNFTPKKIINSNYITTNNMAFPIEANGVVLYPNTGDYIFPTDKVTEIPIMQDGESINNDMKKKLKKYQAGGFMSYQDAYKGFGVGPNLTQDNSYYRSIMPSKIENIEGDINKPSVFSGINDVLGKVNQGVNQATSLMSQFSNMSQPPSQIMPDISNWQSPMSARKTDEQLNFENDQALKSAGLFNYYYPTQGTTMGPASAAPSWQGVPYLKNGGYLRKYQNGGMMDMPVGYPEYIHKSNVFQPHEIPVPRVHFSDDTSVFDMGVNLNDLVQMNGGGIGKYQYGGFMNQPRVFNSNSQRANAAQLAAATENDFMNTKVRNDRQQFADNKVDWGFMDWAKEPVGTVLGLASGVPIVGDLTQDIVGDSFLTRTGGYQVGKGAGSVVRGAGKIAAGIATVNPAMIGSGVGDVGSGVGSTVGNLNAKSAMGDYNKQGYVSGKRLAKTSQDFGNMMNTASSLYGNVSGGVGMANNMGGMSGMMNKLKGGKQGMQGFGNIMQMFSGMGGQGTGGFDFSQLAGLMQQDGGYLNNYQEGGMVLMPEYLEIPKFKKGGLTPTKARQMLHDKSYSTDKQRKYFGYISSQKKANGGWIDTL